jgi:hypothetical protein
MEFGGFPEVVLNEDAEFKIRILRSYYDDIINKDIVARFSVKKIDNLRSLAKFYLTNISSLISFHRGSKFIKLPVETIRRFSSYLETSTLIFFVKRFSYSVKEQGNSPRKIYSIDMGVSNSVGFRFTENLGRLFENIVAVELKRRQSINPLWGIYYWRDGAGKEVDFVIKHGLQIKELIQICFDISSEETSKREISSLRKAMDEFNLKEATAITEDYEGKKVIKDKQITYLPLWKWLFNEGRTY